MAKNKQSVKAFCCERKWILRLLQMVSKVDNQAILGKNVNKIKTNIIQAIMEKKIKY